MKGLGDRLVGGMDRASILMRLPSYLKGSWAQTRACFDPPATFERKDGPAVLLVPGLFCTPSVFNRLGKALEKLGADVHLPPRAYPLSFGPLANTCRLETAARLLTEDLIALREEQGIEQITIAAHSNGVLISLLALASEGFATRTAPEIRGVIAMASPFRGAPVAALLSPVVPACADIKPRSPLLAQISRHASFVKANLISGFDAIVPEDSQHIPDVPAIRMEGFQHMDFLVGSPNKVAHTARRIMDAMTGGGTIHA